MKPRSMLRLFGMVLLTGCTSDYAAQMLPMDHPANPRASVAAFSPPPNPFKQDLSAPTMVAQARAEGEGKVIALVPGSNQIVIEHGEIKGFMDAMTMGYKVNPPSLLKGLNAGDKIRFTIDTEQKTIVRIVKE